MKCPRCKEEMYIYKTNYEDHYKEEIWNCENEKCKIIFMKVYVGYNA